MEASRMPITFEEVSQTVLNLVRENELLRQENAKLKKQVESQSKEQ